MRGLESTQQTSPEPVSRMSLRTTNSPNEHDNIYTQLDKLNGTRIRGTKLTFVPSVLLLYYYYFIIMCNCIRYHNAISQQNQFRISFHIIFRYLLHIGL